MSRMGYTVETNAISVCGAVIHLLQFVHNLLIWFTSMKTRRKLQVFLYSSGGILTCIKAHTILKSLRPIFP